MREKRGGVIFGEDILILLLYFCRGEFRREKEGEWGLEIERFIYCDFLLFDAFMLRYYVK